MKENVVIQNEGFEAQYLSLAAQTQIEKFLWYRSVDRL